MSNYRSFDKSKKENLKNLENLIGGSNFHNSIVEQNNQENFNKNTDVQTSKMSKKVIDLNTQKCWSRKQMESHMENSTVTDFDSAQKNDKKE